MYLEVLAGLSTIVSFDALQVLDILETISQVAKEWMVEMFQHPSLPNDVAHALGTHNCKIVSDYGNTFRGIVIMCVLSSFRMYLRAKVKPVSFRSTIRTLPKAPLPTTRRRRKWLRLTAE